MYDAKGIISEGKNCDRNYIKLKLKKL